MVIYESKYTNYSCDESVKTQLFTDSFQRDINLLSCCVPVWIEIDMSHD